MTTAIVRAKDTTSLILPATLLALAMGAVAVQIVPLPALFPAAGLAAPATITLPPGSVTYRAPGIYLRNGVQVDAPMIGATFDAPLAIMQYQVSAADYGRCVDAGACAPAEPANAGIGDIPVTGVNYTDAFAYAGWLSAATGQVWTLPTDAEWAYAAGDRLVDDALGLGDGTDPAQRWIADYRRQAARQRVGNSTPRPLGSFGANDNGVMDIGGNVWEWTDTCQSKVHVDTAGAVISQTSACSIRLLEGQHRAPMSFIRDARGGACSVGIPPDNLGFRLVRRPAWHEQLLARLGL